MTLLSVNYSNAAVNLIQNGKITVDAIEAVDKVSDDEIIAAKQLLPKIEMHYHQGRMFFTKRGIRKLDHYLRLCPQSPFISIHLAPLPASITTPALRWNLYLPQPNIEFLIKRFIRQINNLKKLFSKPVILENMPILHPTRYRLESDPTVISRILHETQLGMLLDLTHARISAEARKIPVEKYLEQLPLEKVKQIHVTGSRRKEGFLYDAHEQLEPYDYDLLGWTLGIIEPEWLTLEYFKEESDAVYEQVSKLTEIVNSIK